MEEIIEKVKNDLKQILSERRYEHSIGVMNRAGELAEIYNVDIETAKLAGLLHDNAKEMSEDEMLKYVEKNNIEITEFERLNVKILHGKIGADIAKKKYGVSEQIARAIEYHTTTSPQMDILAKIIYVSDKVELTRKSEKFDIEPERKLAKIDLDKGLLVARETLFNILGKDYMVKNDKRPSIAWKDLGDRTLGQCVNANGIKPEIKMHIAFQYNDDLVDDYFMNTLIHEYIHSLKSCVNYNHDGEWERVANLVSNNTNYNISQYASGTESEAFRIAKEKMKEL